MKKYAVALVFASVLTGCVGADPDSGLQGTSPSQDAEAPDDQAIEEVLRTGEVIFLPRESGQCPESTEVSNYEPMTIQESAQYTVSRSEAAVFPETETLRAGTEVCLQTRKDPLDGLDTGDSIPGRLMVELPDVSGSNCESELTTALEEYSWRSLNAGVESAPCVALVGYLTDAEMEDIAQISGVKVERDFVAGMLSQGASGLTSTKQLLTPRSASAEDVNRQFHLDVLDIDWDKALRSPDRDLRPLDDAYHYPTAVYSDASTQQLSELSPVRVFVLDTGIDPFHDEFQSNASSGQSTVSIGAGRNFAKDSENRQWIGPTDWSVRDCQGHGTGIASLIGGANQGVAKNVELIPLRVTFNCDRYEFIRGDNLAKRYLARQVPYSALVEALNHVLNEVTMTPGRPTVVNMSIGAKSNAISRDEDGNDTVLIDVVNQLVNKGVIIVQSAGNDGRDFCADTDNLAATSQVITVGNLWPAQRLFDGNLHESWRRAIERNPKKDAAAERIAFRNQWAQERRHTTKPLHQVYTTLLPSPDSNFGDCIDVWAPGRAYVAAASGADQEDKDKDQDQNKDKAKIVDGLVMQSGTSQAAAVVSGMAALWLHVNQARETLQGDGRNLENFHEALGANTPDLGEIMSQDISNSNSMGIWTSTTDGSLGPIANLRGLLGWGDPCGSSENCAEAINVDLIGDGSSHRVAFDWSDSPDAIEWLVDSLVPDAEGPGDGRFWWDRPLLLKVVVTTPSGDRHELELDEAEAGITLNLDAALVNGRPGDEIVVELTKPDVTELRVITLNDGRLRFENPLGPNTAPLAYSTLDESLMDYVFFSSSDEIRNGAPIAYGCRTEVGTNEDWEPELSRLELFELSAWTDDQWLPSEELIVLKDDPSEWVERGEVLGWEYLGDEDMALASECLTPVNVTAPQARLIEFRN